MEIFFIWATSVALSLLWFFIILKIGKHTVGKDAKLWQILTFLVIAGPIGWITIFIIIAYELVDQTFNLKKKSQKR
jgi:NhaP-type Na+/H+ or K+/H+ antiporter